ncbi:hypothetical protein PSOL_07280 [Candidatus Phytoplasma solani]
MILSLYPLPIIIIIRYKNNSPFPLPIIKRDFLNPKPTKSPKRAEALTKFISIYNKRKKTKKKEPPKLRVPPFFLKTNTIIRAIIIYVYDIKKRKTIFQS